MTVLPLTRLTEKGKKFFEENRKELNEFCNAYLEELDKKIKKSIDKQK